MIHIKSEDENHKVKNGTMNSEEKPTISKLKFILNVLILKNILALSNRPREKTK
jgi:hypothetical protein